MKQCVQKETEKPLRVDDFCTKASEKSISLSIHSSTYWWRRKRAVTICFLRFYRLSFWSTTLLKAGLFSREMRAKTSERIICGIEVMTDKLVIQEQWKEATWKTRSDEEKWIIIRSWIHISSAKENKLWCEEGIFLERTLIDTLENNWCK